MNKMSIHWNHIYSNGILMNGDIMPNTLLFAGD